MPRIYKGQKWEVQYRRDVRSIKAGLTASKNGRGEIKATQLLLKDPDSDKQIAVCWAKNLPWTKKDRSRNLEIIKNAFNLMDESTNLDFKKAIDLSANKYDLSILNKTHSKLNKTMQLTETQTKAIEYLAKRDARSVDQMLHMIMHEGFEWIFNSVTERHTPLLGWTDDWKEIETELKNEYNKSIEVNQ